MYREDYLLYLQTQNIAWVVECNWNEGRPIIYRNEIEKFIENLLGVIAEGEENMRIYKQHHHITRALIY